MSARPGRVDAFTRYRREGVRRFVQTALVIDNEAELKTQDRTTAKPRKPVLRPSGSILKKPSRAAGISEAGPTDSGPGVANATVYSPSEHELNAKELTDAFSDREVICGLYKPQPGERMVQLATKAARHADLVIVDWLLEHNSSKAAREIVVQILKEDNQGKGRLRLIAIYTSQPGIDEIARDLFNQMEADQQLKGLHKREASVISGPNVRICVFSKPQTPSRGNAQVERVPEAELPQRLLSEFSELSRGLLTSFALHSIAAVRRSAHHIVSVFKQELDGAFLAHRASIPNPDEATEFVIHLLVGELQNAIAVDERAEGHTGNQVLNAWVSAEAKRRPFEREGAIAPPALVKGILRGGAEALRAAKGQLKKEDGSAAKGGLSGATVAEIFYASREEAWNHQLEFARLSSFKREASGRTQLPRKWAPSLTLGTVLKVLRRGGRSGDKYKDLEATYYLCMQPRCDSVRLAGVVGFPFQTGEVATRHFNLVVKERSSRFGVPILVNSKPGNTVVLKFEPDPKLGIVRARCSGGQFVFKDVAGRRFVWVGDIRDLKAQQDASALAASVHRVGLDEQEWLRLAGQKDVEILPPSAST